MSDSRVGTVSADWKLATRLRLWSLHVKSLEPSQSSSKLPFLQSVRVTHGLCALDYNKRSQVHGTITLFRWQPYLLLHESSSPYLEGTGKFGNVEMWK
jgi:hypothetical protein